MNNRIRFYELLALVSAGVLLAVTARGGPERWQFTLAAASVTFAVLHNGGDWHW